MLVVALPARFPLRFLIALALGALHAAAFVADAAWPLEIAALAGLAALAVREARESAGPGGARRAAFAGARLGFAFGLGWFGVGVSWIYISLHTYGELDAPFAAAAVLAFCAYLAIWPAFACAGFTVFRRARGIGSPTRHLASIGVFAALWTLSEYARGFVFTGFPWLAAGYAHVGGPLAGYGPVVGVYGVCLVAAAIAAAIALSANRRQRVRGAVLTATLALVLGVPLAGDALARVDWTRPLGRPIGVRLVQGNVAQDAKFLGENFQRTTDAYLDAIEAATGERRADLVVLPETAFPVFLGDLPPAVAERLARDARALKADIAFGIPIDEPGGRYFNSVLAVGPSSDARGTEAADPGKAPLQDVDGEHPGSIVAQRYDKSHLVPFGEFVPTGFHWFMRLIEMPLGDFTRGAPTQPPMRLAGAAIGFDVCYEDLFGASIARQAEAANLLVNVSNVAWFGDSMALPQHLGISRMRAIETGRPLLRATNTGMTAAIDPHGRVTAVLAPFTAASLDVVVDGTTGATPYVHAGDVPVLALVAGLLVAAFASTRAGRSVTVDAPVRR